MTEIPSAVAAGNGEIKQVNGVTPVKEQFIKMPEVSVDVLHDRVLLNEILTLRKVASYPTGSLDFLVKLQKEDQKRQKALQTSNSSDQDIPSRVRLNIIIVGAGLGGLAAAIALARKGHEVKVVEQAPALAEVCRLVNLYNHASADVTL